MSRNDPSSKRSRGRWRLTVITGAFLSLTVLTALIAFGQGEPSSASGQTAPGSAGIQGDVQTLDLAAYPGKVVVVNFMAAWCTSCLAEIPRFVQLHEELEDAGLQMIGVSLQTPTDQTEAIIQRFNITYPVFEDPTGRAARERFQLRTMPTTFIFKDGKQVRRLDGAVSADELRNAVEEFL